MKWGLYLHEDGTEAVGVVRGDGVTTDGRLHPATAREVLEALNAAEIEKTKLALTVIEAAAALPRWIPVEERLPDENTDVLALLDDGSAVVASRTGAHWAAYGVDRESDSLAYTSLDCIASTIARVTHWMPLPAPPEGP